MNNKDFKKKLNKAYENKTPDVYSKVRKTPINYNVFIESPEQAKKRKIVLILVCMLFIILAVLVVSLFSFIIPPSAPSAECPYVYTNITINNTAHFGVVIDDTFDTLVCLMNEDAKCNKDIANKTYNDIWSLVDIHAGDVVAITTYALGYDQMDKISILLNSSLQSYCVEKGISVTVTSSNMAMNVYLTNYINSFGKEQIAITDSPSTIISAYIYVSATNQNV